MEDTLIQFANYIKNDLKKFSKEENETFVVSFLKSIAKTDLSPKPPLPAAVLKNKYKTCTYAEIVSAYKKDKTEITFCMWLYPNDRFCFEENNVQAKDGIPLCKKCSTKKTKNKLLDRKDFKDPENEVEIFTQEGIPKTRGLPILSSDDEEDIKLKDKSPEKVKPSKEEKLSDEDFQSVIYEDKEFFIKLDKETLLGFKGENGLIPMEDIFDTEESQEKIIDIIYEKHGVTKYLNPKTGEYIFE